MKAILHPCTAIQGHYTPPASKSEGIRALFYALLSPGESLIHGLTPSEDLSYAQKVIEDLGAILHTQTNPLKVHSKGSNLQPRTQMIETGNSGITTRFTLPLLGLRADPDRPIRFRTGQQMQTRPLEPLISALQTLGMRMKVDGPELLVTGCLEGGEAQISGLTSQFLSALLIALPLARKTSIIQVQNLNERPYVEMTIKGLKERGIRLKHEKTQALDRFEIPGEQRYAPKESWIPKDFSAASTYLAAGVLIPGEIQISGLDLNETQGDKELINILQAMGADLQLKDQNIILRGGKPLKGLTLDARDIPDLLPTLAVLGTQAEGRTEILHVPQARLKETDRIHSMTEGLRTLGAQIEEHEDGMTIYPSTLKGGTVKGYGDHRTVMALSLAGLLSNNQTEITQAESVSKTYPHFFEDLESLGASLEVKDER